MDPSLAARSQARARKAAISRWLFERRKLVTWVSWLRDKAGACFGVSSKASRLRPLLRSANSFDASSRDALDLVASIVMLRATVSVELNFQPFAKVLDTCVMATDGCRGSSDIWEAINPMSC
jgi:hypothetical protein